jgi:hypothetical protein
MKRTFCLVAALAFGLLTAVILTILWVLHTCPTSCHLCFFNRSSVAHSVEVVTDGGEHYHVAAGAFSSSSIWLSRSRDEHWVITLDGSPDVQALPCQVAKDMRAVDIELTEVTKPLISCEPGRSFDTM